VLGSLFWNSVNSGGVSSHAPPSLAVSSEIASYPLHFSAGGEGPLPAKRNNAQQQLILILLFYRSASLFAARFLFVSPCSLFQAAGGVTIGLLAFWVLSGVQLSVAGVSVDGAAVASLWALLIWPFAVEKTEEEEAAEKGASV